MSKVTIDLDGTTYTGQMTVARRMVTVSTVYGSKSMQQGGSQPDAIAGALLREIVREEMARKDSMI